MLVQITEEHVLDFLKDRKKCPITRALEDLLPEEISDRILVTWTDIVILDEQNEEVDYVLEFSSELRQAFKSWVYRSAGAVREDGPFDFEFEMEEPWTWEN